MANYSSLRFVCIVACLYGETNSDTRLAPSPVTTNIIKMLWLPLIFLSLLCFLPRFSSVLCMLAGSFLLGANPWCGAGSPGLAAECGVGGWPCCLPRPGAPQLLFRAFCRIPSVSTFRKSLGGSFGCLLCTYFKDNHILKRKMGK